MYYMTDDYVYPNDKQGAKQGTLLQLLFLFDKDFAEHKTVESLATEMKNFLTH